MTVSLLLQVWLGVLFYRLLVELFGARAAILVPFAVFAFSPITLPAFLWWAAALNQLPQQIAMVGVLLLHVQYLRSGRVRRGAAAVLALAGGLLFSEKTLLAVPLVVAVTYAYAAGGAPWPRLRQVWHEHRRVWGAYLLLCVPYTIYYVVAVPNPGRSGAKGGQLAALGATAVRDGIFPGLLGGPWTWHPIGFAGALAAPGPIATFVSAVVVVAVIIGDGGLEPWRRAGLDRSPPASWPSTWCCSASPEGRSTDPSWARNTATSPIARWSSPWPSR